MPQNLPLAFNDTFGYTSRRVEGELQGLDPGLVAGASLALGRTRQKDSQFEVSQGYIVGQYLKNNESMNE